MPLSSCWSLIALLVWVPFRRSVTGRTVYAIGSAEGAAYMSGLPIDRAKLAAFTLGRLLRRLRRPLPRHPDLLRQCRHPAGRRLHAQLHRRRGASAAPRSLGGIGSAIGSIVGALILRAISFNFRIFDIDPLLQPLFEGLVLLAAVSLGALRVLRVKNRLELFR